MDASTFADSVGSIFASCSIESVGLEAGGPAGMSLGRDPAGGATACAASRGSPLRLGRGAIRGSMAMGSGGPLPERAGCDEGVYMSSELGGVAEGRGEPLMRSGAVAGTPADASVRPCTQQAPCHGLCACGTVCCSIRCFMLSLQQHM